MDWFFGFKLHIVVNELGQLLNVTLSPGNIDDRQPVPDLLSELFGKIFADRGYVSCETGCSTFRRLWHSVFC